MDAHEVEEVLKDLDRRTACIEQNLPALDPAGDIDAAGYASDDAVERLREDIRRLAADLEAIDRRDAAQHGGVKGEIAHVVRRITRLESMPGLRRAR
jgi:hypothetical protein